MNEDKFFIEGHVVGLFADTLGKRGKQIKVASGDIVDIDDDFIYKSIGPETGHSDEAPRYVKNILARLRELPVHDREVWLKAIMSEFEQDFSHAKWREGYEQGKLEGAWVGEQLKDADKIRRELNKVKVPQFVANWIEYFKKCSGTLYGSTAPYSYYGRAITDDFEGDVTEVLRWIRNNSEVYARAWLDGYEIEEEKRYLVKIKGNIKENMLVYGEVVERYFFTKSYTLTNANYAHTRKQLEDAGFGWVFDCPGIEIEEVE